MRHLALLAVLLVSASCTSKIGNSQEGTADAQPIEVRDPPEPKEGSGTAVGCEGVSARGECQQGSAVYCDLDRGRLRRVDCEALGKNCILDIGRGAVCKSLEESDTGEGSGSASACTDTGISETGFCTTADEAVYCDTSGAEPVTRTWDCSSEGMTCGVGDCAEGAFCCGDESSAGVETCEEAGLDFDGVCDGEVAKWCLDGLPPQERDCAALGQRCEVDTCATGAFCCGDIDLTGDLTPEEECAALGLEGICVDGATARYCLGDDIIVDNCEGTEVCEVDTCMLGAGCCEPAGEPTNACEAIGFEGVCDDENTLRYCFGDTDAEIEIETCAAGTVCEVDDIGWAECVEVIDPCADLDANGICEDEVTLKYCIGSELSVVDCFETGTVCEVDATGYADCV